MYVHIWWAKRLILKYEKKKKIIIFYHGAITGRLETPLVKFVHMYCI